MRHPDDHPHINPFGDERKLDSKPAEVFFKAGTNAPVGFGWESDNGYWMISVETCLTSYSNRLIAIAELEKEI